MNSVVERDALATASVYHDFQLADGLERCCLTFEHRVFEDAGEIYSPVLCALFSRVTVIGRHECWK